MNQDQFLVARLRRSMRVESSTLDVAADLFGNAQGELLLVADGMGGHAAGDRASRLAIGHMMRRLLDRPQSLAIEDEEQAVRLVQELSDILNDAHRKILRESAEVPRHHGMGTTLTLALVIGHKLHVVHVGDSRCYLIRRGNAEQLTTDHTLARQMVEAGGMKPEDESNSRWSNVLWNVLGGLDESEVKVEVRTVGLQPGDTVVLCTDGLHRYVDARHLAAIVNASDSPATACDRLVSRANEAGGEDNITVVVSRRFGDSDDDAWEDFDTVIP